MSLIADYGLVLLVLACLFGFFMAWGVGANDVANAMGTSVGSRALTIKQAILIAMVFEFAGAYLAGGQVTETIKSGIVDASMISPNLMVLGMMSALLAAGTWLLVASTKGWPVSTTHSIVGAVIGFAAVGVSMDAVHWGGVGPIVASWVISPVLSGVVAFGVFMSVQKLIIDTETPLTCQFHKPPGFNRNILDSSRQHISQNRHQQSTLGRYGNPEIDVIVVDDLVAVDRAVDGGQLLQSDHDGAGEKRHQSQRYTVFLLKCFFVSLAHGHDL